MAELLREQHARITCIACRAVIVLIYAANSEAGVLPVQLACPYCGSHNPVRVSRSSIVSCTYVVRVPQSTAFH